MFLLIARKDDYTMWIVAGEKSFHVSLPKATGASRNEYACIIEHQKAPFNLERARLSCQARTTDGATSDKRSTYWWKRV